MKHSPCAFHLSSFWRARCHAHTIDTPSINTQWETLAAFIKYEPRYTSENCVRALRFWHTFTYICYILHPPYMLHVVHHVAQHGRMQNRRFTVFVVRLRLHEICECTAKCRYCAKKELLELSYRAPQSGTIIPVRSSIALRSIAPTCMDWMMMHSRRCTQHTQKKQTQSPLWIDRLLHRHKSQQGKTDTYGGEGKIDRPIQMLHDAFDL